MRVWYSLTAPESWKGAWMLWRAQKELVAMIPGSPPSTDTHNLHLWPLVPGIWLPIVTQRVDV